MKYVLLPFSIFLLLCQELKAQVPGDSLLPEVLIQELVHQPYTAGIKRQELDSLSLQLRRGQSLASLLQELSPLYVREYGPGQLSTISFRGTSSSHTAVLWNGLNINSPTLGQTDFSQIPLFALENVQVQYGSSSSLYGSDALGGSIQLQTKPDQWRQGFSARMRQEVGSFGSYFTGLASNWTNKRWQSDVRLYRRSAENDFPYTNTSKKAEPRETNTHSALWLEGAVAQLGFKPAPNREWWLQGWWQRGWRQIQPMMGSTSGSDEQADAALRMSLQYRQVLRKGEWQAQAGWLTDELRFNSDRFKTRQFIAKADWERDLGKTLQMEAGSQWNWRQGINENYRDAENRLEVSTRLRWQPTRFWESSLNLRQVLTDQVLGPLSPSLGTEIRPLRQLTFKLLGGRHYRLPTLNDRFWPLVGQADLNPEKGWHAEAGVATSKIKVAGGQLKAELTGYWMWIDNWIMWRPVAVAGSSSSLWGPVNLREVYSRGWETSLHWQNQFLNLGALGAYTRSENQNALSEFDRTVGQQLPFVPLWKGSAWARLTTHGWLGELTGQYTGRRFTAGVEDENFSLPPFYLLQVSAGKTLSLQQHTLGLLLQLQNLLNHQYQSYENRAMPGRSIHLTINYIFTKNQP